MSVPPVSIRPVVDLFAPAPQKVVPVTASPRRLGSPPAQLGRRARSCQAPVTTMQEHLSHPATCFLPSPRENILLSPSSSRRDPAALGAAGAPSQKTVYFGNHLVEGNKTCRARICTFDFPKTLSRSTLQMPARDPISHVERREGPPERRRSLRRVGYEATNVVAHGGWKVRDQLSTEQHPETPSAIQEHFKRQSSRRTSLSVDNKVAYLVAGSEDLCPAAGMRDYTAGDKLPSEQHVRGNDTALLNRFERDAKTVPNPQLAVSPDFIESMKPCDTASPFGAQLTAWQSEAQLSVAAFEADQALVASATRAGRAGERCGGKVPALARASASTPAFPSTCRSQAAVTLSSRRGVRGCLGQEKLDKRVA